MSLETCRFKLKENSRLLSVSLSFSYQPDSGPKIVARLWFWSRKVSQHVTWIVESVELSKLAMEWGTMELQSIRHVALPKVRIPRCLMILFMESMDIKSIRLYSQRRGVGKKESMWIKQGLNALTNPTHLLTRHGAAEYGWRLLSEGRFMGIITTRSIAASVFGAQLLKQMLSIRPILHPSLKIAEEPLDDQAADPSQADPVELFENESQKRVKPFLISGITRKKRGLGAEALGPRCQSEGKAAASTDTMGQTQWTC